MQLKRSKQDNKAYFLKKSIKFLISSKVLFISSQEQQMTFVSALTSNYFTGSLVLFYMYPGCAVKLLYTVVPFERFFLYCSLERNVTKLSGTFREAIPKGNEVILILFLTNFQV